VNNFSEVNAEIIDELDKAIDTGIKDELKSMTHDLRENELKIIHHGQRADAIVKSMLQHSRTSTGLKEPTDINALCDEYLRLAYQGLRAREKSFNCALQTDFDPAIGKANIIPQDIGRVLLNLYNNAFYAVNEKMKTAGQDYEPKVIIRTLLAPASENSLIPQSANSIIISVSDNGTGIPEKVKEKIFQPFFTTKPSGQGMGLGLSLSYDIVKAHGGEIKVESIEGEGSEFSVFLPVK
jgi:signal transduction histidine kinase